MWHGPYHMALLYELPRDGDANVDEMRFLPKLASWLGLVIVCIAVGLLVAAMVSVSLKLREPSGELATQIELRRFVRVLKICLAAKHETSFPSSLQDAISHVPGTPGGCRMIFANRYSWEREFIYSIDPCGNVLIIRSVGKNGIDENGFGDDILVIATIWDRLN